MKARYIRLSASSHKLVVGQYTMGFSKITLLEPRRHQTLESVCLKAGTCKAHVKAQSCAEGFWVLGWKQKAFSPNIEA